MKTTDRSVLSSRPIVVEMVSTTRDLFTESDCGRTIGQHVDLMIADIQSTGGNIRELNINLAPDNDLLQSMRN